MVSTRQQLSKTRSGKVYKKNTTRVYYNSYEELKAHHQFIFDKEPAVHERTRVSTTYILLIITKKGVIIIRELKEHAMD